MHPFAAVEARRIEERINERVQTLEDKLIKTMVNKCRKGELSDRDAGMGFYQIQILRDLKEGFRKDTLNAIAEVEDDEAS